MHTVHCREYHRLWDKPTGPTFGVPTRLMAMIRMLLRMLPWVPGFRYSLSPDL
jgi:hypothetical protein